jgi:DNA-binding FadR family transcriptional regulator
MDVSLPQHEAIIDAVIAGDPEAARTAMHEHLASVLVTLQQWSESSVAG